MRHRASHLVEFDVYTDFLAPTYENQSFSVLSADIHGDIDRVGILAAGVVKRYAQLFSDIPPILFGQVPLQDRLRVIGCGVNRHLNNESSASCFSGPRRRNSDSIAASVSPSTLYSARSSSSL